MDTTPAPTPAPASSAPSAPSALNDQAPQRSKAWDIVREFALSDCMSLPDAKHALEQLLGRQYIAGDWSEALNAVMLAEGDVNAALEGIEKLTPFSIALGSSYPTTSAQAL